jgi:hypothetical protein
MRCALVVRRMDHARETATEGLLARRRIDRRLARPATVDHAVPPHRPTVGPSPVSAAAAASRRS